MAIYKENKAAAPAEGNAGSRYEWEDGPMRYSADEKWGLERMERGEWLEADDPAAITSACDRILRLAAENAKLIEDGQIVLKALRILAYEMWAALRDGEEFESQDLSDHLEAAGLIEMLADQTWGLTELGGRVCRREP